MVVHEVNQESFVIAMTAAFAITGFLSATMGWSLYTIADENKDTRLSLIILLSILIGITLLFVAVSIFLWKSLLLLHTGWLLLAMVGSLVAALMVYDDSTEVIYKYAIIYSISFAVTLGIFMYTLYKYSESSAKKPMSSSLSSSLLSSSSLFSSLKAPRSTTTNAKKGI